MKLSHAIAAPFRVEQSPDSVCITCQAHEPEGTTTWEKPANLDHLLCNRLRRFTVPGIIRRLAATGL